MQVGHPHLDRLFANAQESTHIDQRGPDRSVRGQEKVSATFADILPVCADAVRIGKRHLAFQAIDALSDEMRGARIRGRTHGEGFPFRRRDIRRHSGFSGCGLRKGRQDRRAEHGSCKHELPHQDHSLSLLRGSGAPRLPIERGRARDVPSDRAGLFYASLPN